MIQLKCIRMIEDVDGTRAKFLFQLYFDGKSAKQFAEFELAPDFCDLGDTYNVTSQDFEVQQSKANDSKVFDPSKLNCRSI